MKVSFDFDGTLSRTDVQEFAKKLIDDGLDVWICTSRSPSNNDDLFKVANELGIPKSNIIFTNYKDKADHLTNDFIWHLDDDWIELDLINKKTTIVGISVFGNPFWREDCLKILV